MGYSTGFPLNCWKIKRFGSMFGKRSKNMFGLKKGDSLKIGWKVNITGKNRVKLGEVGGNDVKTWAEMARSH